MSETFRGGNSRNLARQLDQLHWPIVLLDQRQQIVFVSAALCELLQIDSTRLVGLSCQAELAADIAPGRATSDAEPEASRTPIPPQVSMMLAPPSSVLHGQAAIRQVPWPPTQPQGLAGQAFLPLIDEDPSAGLILVLFGQPDVVRNRFAPLAPPIPPRGNGADEILMRLRAQWEQLDGLWPLLGTSSSIQLAMRRAQLALGSTSSVMISGPEGSAKSRLARTLAAHRRRALELPANLIHELAIECSLMDQESLANQLEAFQSRLRSGVPAIAAHLILDRVDCLNSNCVTTLSQWLQERRSGFCVIATSQRSPASLSNSSPALESLTEQLSTIDIVIPPLAERREDVLPMVAHHLTTVAHKAGRRLPGLASGTEELLQAYAWPGNAAEVQQAAVEMLNNAVLTATIQPNHLPIQIRTFASTILRSSQAVVEPIVLDDVLLDLERIMLQRAIKLSPRNRARAARLLGISRPRFLRRIAQLGLDQAPATSDEEE